MNRRVIVSSLLILIVFAGILGCRSSQKTKSESSNTIVLDVEPAVSFQSDHIRGNSLITIDYHWKTGPSFVPPKESLRAKVHFTDESGTIYWQDDHLLTPSPDTWSPGGDIHYQRVVYVPVIPRVTQIYMLVGLYSPKDKTHKYQLHGRSFGKDKFIVAQFTVSPPRRPEDLPGVGIKYLDGWYDLETDPEGHTTWRWMQKTAVCLLKNPHQDAKLYISGWVPASRFDHPSTLKVFLDGREMGTYSDLVEQFNVLIPVSKELFDEKDELELKLVADQEYVPAQVEKSTTDTRHLALMIKTLYFH